jgi:hypothetical protein
VQYSEGWVSEKTSKGQLCLQAEEAGAAAAAPAADDPAATAKDGKAASEPLA